MNIRNEIMQLAFKYRNTLKEKIVNRVQDMRVDNNEHYLIYKVLGISAQEGELIDIYQNKGRFLYKYAGSFLEEATILCFKYNAPKSLSKFRINNTIGIRPKTFEIDCLVGNRAYEIKWRDATTDGDHITKEHTRAKNIVLNGYIPVRIMFYYPQREQAIRIQSALKDIYFGIGGEYYSGEEAWNYVLKTTGIDLKAILTNIANEEVLKNE